jgi:hypothetical protein
MNIKSLFALVPLVLLLHELEEWNNHSYHESNFAAGESIETNLSERLFLVFLSLTGFVWVAICSFISNLAVCAALNLLLVDFTLLNGLEHLAITAKKRRYYPGFICGGVIGTALDIVIIYKVGSENVLPLWLVAMLVALVVPGLIDAVAQSRKNRLPKFVKAIARFSLELEKAFTR